MDVNSIAGLQEALQLAMKEAGIEQASELAERTGVPATTIRTWLSRSNQPRVLELAKAALVLRISMDRLVYTGNKALFRDLGISDDLKGLEEPQITDLAATISALAKMAKKLPKDMDVISPFRRHIEDTARLCEQMNQKRK